MVRRLVRDGWRVAIIAMLGLFLPGCAAGGHDAQTSSFRTHLRQVAHVRLASAGADDGRLPVEGNGPLSAVSLGGAARPRAGWDWSVDGEPFASEEVTRGAALRPLPGLFETMNRDILDTPAVFWADVKAVYGSRTNLMTLGLAYGASLVLHQTGVDDTIERSFRRRSHRTFKQDFLDGLGAVGNPLTHLGLAGIWYVVGQQSQNERTYNVGLRLFRALHLTSMSTFLGKVASWDRSPNGEWGSFPSGHTAGTFAFASVLHREYGPAIGVPLYTLGGLVAYSRLEDDEHRLSDVVMGSVLGLVIGHAIAGDNEPPEIFGGHLVPYADPATASTGMVWLRPILYAKRASY